MKRMFALLLAAALLLSLLPACNRQAEAAPTQPVETDGAGPEPTVSEPADSVLPQEDLSASDVLLGVWTTLGTGLANAETYGITDGDDRDMLPVYIEGAYGLSDGEWEDAALARETGASAVELAVLRFADEDGARHGEDCLKDYLHSREGDFTGYAPDQAKLVADAALCREGKYVGLFICEESTLAGTAFTKIIKAGGLTLSDMPGPAPTPTPEPTATPELEEAPVDPYDIVTRLLVEAVGVNLLSYDRTQIRRTSEMDTSDNEIGYDGDVERVYGISRDQYLECTVAFWTPEKFEGFGLFTADHEMVLFFAANEAQAAAIVETLNGYLAEKEASLRERGETAAADLVAQGRAAQSGNYALLAVWERADNAVLFLSRAIADETNGYSRRYYQSGQPATPVDSERVPFIPPNKDDMSLYDTSAIRAAWASGDPSGLSEYDRETYDAAKAILGEILTDGMTDLEKETAIYYWLVNNVDYDWRHQDIMAETPRSSYEPHGGLVDYTAVCLGYATSFQLLMDLAGVECITVPGAAFQSEEDHAWNMVRLNGNWYCVDVTWDANHREQLGPGEPENWRYFNITSDEMAAKNHQWDYANTPEATAEDHGRS